MTPDADFAIGTIGAVTVAAGCSGHAFKFGPALGELIADTSDGNPRPAAAMFALDRRGAGRAGAGPVPADHALVRLRGATPPERYRHAPCRSNPWPEPRGPTSSGRST